MTTRSHDPVPFARALVDNRTLDAFASVAAKAQIADRLEEAEAALLIQNAASIASELQQRRRAAEVIRDLVDPDVVQLYPGALA